ncbi:MAG: efflux RND transporter permease subunit, partial [Proteobacteria bacterium]|nr:efflux RND transporter permease subunit [Pseudomonadota bacterium]
EYDLNIEADRIKRALEQVEGVRKVNLQGAHKDVIHIRLDPQSLRSLGYSATDIRERISTSNRDVSWGRIQSNTGTLPLYLEGRFNSVEDIRNFVVANQNGENVIRLKDIAQIENGLENPKGKTDISIDGQPFQPAIGFSIQKRPGEDTLAVIERIRNYIEIHTSDSKWPSMLNIMETSSEGELIEESFSEIQGSLLQGVIAVFFILLFALTWREAIVAALAMPIALLGALMMISFGGFTLNSLVIIGMVIALGLLVDVFILVMEGMHEHIYMRGKSFNESAVETVKQFFMPALAGQTTTILAMVPLIMIGGIDGKFIRLIPLTTIGCLVASLIIAFLICIPLSRFVLENASLKENKKTKVDVLTEKAGKWLQSWLLAIPISNRVRAGIVGIIALATFLVAMSLMADLPTIVYPKEDRRPLGVTIQLKPDATLEDANRVAKLAGDALKEKPYFSNVITHAGELSPYSLVSINDYLQESRTYYIVGVSALFTPKDQRENPAYQYLQEIREILKESFKNEPGLTTRLSADLSGASSEDPIQIRLYGENPAILRDIATDIKTTLGNTPGTSDIRDNMGPMRTELRFKANKTALSFYDLTEADLMEQIRIATSNSKIGSFKMPGSQPDLDIQLSMASQANSQGLIPSGIVSFYELETLSVQTRGGDFAPFLSLVNPVVESVGTNFVHLDGVRSVTVQSRLSGDTTAESVYAQLEPKLENMIADCPEGYRFEIAGEAENTEETYGNSAQALLIAMLMVFGVLALLFSSFRQPFIIMTMAPLALTGMGFGFFILQIPISFPAMIGVIALIGIVVNDAIVMVQVMNHHRADGMDIYEAAAHGASDRLRPILTTSITTIAGLTPLAFSSPSWFPLCMAIIWGLGFSTILALIVIPALYVLFTTKLVRQQ